MLPEYVLIYGNILRTVGLLDRWKGLSVNQENQRTREPENQITRKPENQKTRKPDNQKTRKPENQKRASRLDPSV